MKNKLNTRAGTFKAHCNQALWTSKMLNQRSLKSKLKIET